MPKLVRLPTTDNREISVNCSQVRYISQPSKDREHVILHFDNEHTITVVGTLSDVEGRLRLDINGP